jgi:phosphoribosyl 1,2-cyclic phosphodiesterase
LRLSRIQMLKGKWSCWIQYHGAFNDVLEVPHIAWPVDRIILTHSHWDHTQGIRSLREKTAESNSPFELLASAKAYQAKNIVRTAD